MRSDETRELLADPCAFALLALIACRAQRTFAFNRHGLAPGESLIGDYKASGLSEQQYRTAKSKLSDWKFATFKSTNKGTIATIIDTRVFDINAEPVNGQINEPATDKQRTANEPATTTNNVNKVKNARRGSIHPAGREFWKLEKDEARLENRLAREQENQNPDKELIRAFREQLQQVRKEMKPPKCNPA